MLDEKTLYQSLKGKWIAGAALDVVDEELPNWQNPMPNWSRLLQKLAPKHIWGIQMGLKSKRGSGQQSFWFDPSPD